jgi:hypothetical protein
VTVPPRSSARWGATTLEVAVVAGLGALLLLAAWAGGFHDGSIGRVGQRVYGTEIGWWALYSTANSVAAVLVTVSVSTVIGITLGLACANRRRTLLRRWLELVCALPAFVITALWMMNSTRAPTLVLALCVAGQRGLQIAVVVSRAEQCRLTTASRSLYPVAHLGLGELGRWRSLLWVTAAHSAVLLAAEQAALVLLGLLPPVPDTWVATLCAAATGAAQVSGLAVTLAVLGAVALPWALWARAGLAQPPTNASSSVT